MVNADIAIASFGLNLKKNTRIGIIIPPPPRPETFAKAKKIITIIRPAISRVWNG